MQSRAFYCNLGVKLSAGRIQCSLIGFNGAIFISTRTLKNVYLFSYFSPLFLFILIRPSCNPKSCVGLKKLSLMYFAEINSKVPISCTKIQCGRFEKSFLFWYVCIFWASTCSLFYFIYLVYLTDWEQGENGTFVPHMLTSLCKRH